MRRLAPLILILLLPAVCHAQKVTLPPAVYGEVGEWILVPIKVDGGPAKTELSEGLTEPPLWNVFPPEALKLMTGKVVKARFPGTYTLKAWNAKGDVASDVETCKVVVGGTPPVPPGPTPPGPVPPGPTPPVPPVPVPATGLRVLFVYESSANHTREQLNILNSTKLAAYLNQKCAKTDGKPDWRRWDKDVNVDNENAILKQLWKDVKPSVGPLPSLVVVADSKATVYPLPATEQATLDLLQKIGGP